MVPKTKKRRHSPKGGGSSQNPPLFLLFGKHFANGGEDHAAEAFVDSKLVEFRFGNMFARNRKLGIDKFAAESLYTVYRSTTKKSYMKNMGYHRKKETTPRRVSYLLGKKKTVRPHEEALKKYTVIQSCQLWEQKKKTVFSNETKNCF